MFHSTYLSPLRILDEAGENTSAFDSGAINRVIMKGSQLQLSEFEIRALQELNAENWAYHSIIYQNPGLLQFLERNSFDEVLLQKAYYFHYKPDFVRFVSPFFSESFGRITDILIKKSDHATLEKLVNYSGFIRPEDNALAYKFIEAWLIRQTADIRSLNWETFQMNESILDPVFSGEWIRIFQMLPGYLEGLMKEWITTIIDLINSLRGKATSYYLQQVCAQLVLITKNEELRERLFELESGFRKNAETESRKAPVPDRESRALWVVGIIILLGLGLILYQYLAPEKEKEVITAGNFGEDLLPENAVDRSSVQEQLTSSSNEKTLKQVLAHMKFEGSSGRPGNPGTGISPFENLSQLPPGEGEAMLVVKNRTPYDALLFYFTTDNLLLHGRSRPYAVYIKKGEDLRIQFTPNFGRFNLVFGQQWSRLKDPILIPIQDPKGNNAQGYGQDGFSEYWKVDSYFSRTLPNQYFLNHDITINNFSQNYKAIEGVPTTIVAYEPPSHGRYKGQGMAELMLLNRNSTPTLKASGTLYVYVSPETF